jgi:hypothetical protein
MSKQKDLTKLIETDIMHLSPEYDWEYIKQGLSEQTPENYFRYLKESEAKDLKGIVRLAKEFNPDYKILAFGSSVMNSPRLGEKDYEDIDVLFWNSSKEGKNDRFTSSLSFIKGEEKLDFGNPSLVRQTEFPIPREHWKYFMEQFAPWTLLFHSTTNSAKFQEEYQNLSLDLSIANENNFHFTITPSMDAVYEILKKSREISLDKYNNFVQNHPQNETPGDKLFPTGVILFDKEEV